MKKNTLIIGILSLILSCESLEEQNEQLESEICNCINKKFDSLGIDIKNESLRFEQYLVDNKQLIDKSGNSYIKVFEIAAKENRFPLESNFVIKNLKIETFNFFKKCFASRRDNLKKTKILRFIAALDSIYETHDVGPSKLAITILNNLDSSDFEKELYKTYALNVFYLTAKGIASNRTDAGNLILCEIKVTNDLNIYLNNGLVDIDDISKEILNLTKDLTKDDLESYIVEIVIDSEVKMSVINDIKKQLKKARSMQINNRSKK
jgi:hypothetical protein